MFEFKEGDSVRAAQDDGDGYYWEGIVVEVAGRTLGIKDAYGAIRWFNYTAVSER